MKSLRRIVSSKFHPISTTITPTKQDSLIELLPLNILHLFFTYLPPPDALLFALSSPVLYTTYLSTNPTIPSLWTHVYCSPSIWPLFHTHYPKPLNMPQCHSTNIDRPVGCFLQQMRMFEGFRLVRFSKEQGKDGWRFVHGTRYEELPPLFVRRSWRDGTWGGKKDESKVFRRWAIHYACFRSVDEEEDFSSRHRADYASSLTTASPPAWIQPPSSSITKKNEVTRTVDGKLRRYILPHPKGMSGYNWHYAARKAIEDDRWNWKSQEEWEAWWLGYEWKELVFSARGYAEEMVKDGLGMNEPAVSG